MNETEAIISKSEAIHELELKMLDILKQMIDIAKKGASKYPKVTLRRAFKLMALAMHARQIKTQISLIKEQPIIPPGGLTIVGGK